jgi:uncharacterized protein YjbJ (UPF0337 family)
VFCSCWVGRGAYDKPFHDPALAVLAEYLIEEPLEGHYIMGGKADETIGRIKEAAGALTGDDKLRAEGKTDQAVGRAKRAVQKAVDKVKDAAETVVDKAKDKFN